VLCICGSGRSVGRCHGVGGRERRHRGRELRALGELHDLAYLFPFVRPKGADFELFADRLAAQIGEEDREATPEETTPGVQLLSEDERHRIVRSWAGRYPERRRKVRASVGDPGVAETTLVASAVRGAVADRHPCPRGMIEALEAGELKSSPGAALAFAIKPDTVWSYEEVLVGGVVTEEHVARLRMQLEGLERRLPIDGLPRASATLLEGCRLMVDESLVCRLAELLLTSYELQMGRPASYIRSGN